MDRDRDRDGMDSDGQRCTVMDGDRDGMGIGMGINKKPSGLSSQGLCIRKWQLPTLPPGGAVPSAMVSLTSLFGMGRGGSSPL